MPRARRHLAQRALLVVGCLMESYVRFPTQELNCTSEDCTICPSAPWLACRAV
jgi:hypothetical protein